MADESLAREIETALAHQLTWRRVMSGSYFATSAAGIVCSGLATVLAGLDRAPEAAVFAGTATVLFGLEKAMLFREKWAHHLSISTQLEALRLQFLHGGLTDDKAARRMAEILEEYAVKLPIARRETVEH